jgi:hypothetical protein
MSWSSGSATLSAYPDFSPSSLPPLCPRIGSFYRWLHRWHGQTNDLHACTGYFARKQQVSERTVYRWLAVLRSQGYIATEQTIGVERRITPLLEAPPKRRQFRTNRQKTVPKMSGVCQGSVSGVSSLIASDALKDTTTAANTKGAAGVQPVPDVEAVAALRSAGVSDAVASRIVCAKGRKAVLDAVTAYRAARNVRNPVGWLIRAVEQRYCHVPKDAPEGPRMARRVPVVVPPVVSSTGLEGYAAFAAMRDRLTGKGR